MATTEEKIMVQFRPVGGAPVLKSSKITVWRSYTVGELAAFIQKKVKSEIEEGDQIIL